MKNNYSEKAKTIHKGGGRKRRRARKGYRGRTLCGSGKGISTEKKNMI